MYSPYVGKTTTKELKAFLARVVASHVEHHSKNNADEVWTMGRGHELAGDCPWTPGHTEETLTEVQYLAVDVASVEGTRLAGANPDHPHKGWCPICTHHKAGPQV